MAYGRDWDTVGWVAENAEYFFNALQKGNALGDYCFWEVLLLKVLDAPVLCFANSVPCLKWEKVILWNYKKIYGEKWEKSD